MTVKERGTMIGNIMSFLRFNADIQKKPMPDASTVLMLAFKSDEELEHIARLLNM